MWTRSQDRRLRVVRLPFKMYPWTTAACTRLPCALDISLQGLRESASQLRGRKR